MTERLSGLEVEYAIALIYSQRSGQAARRRLPSMSAKGTRIWASAAQTPVLFDVRPAVAVKLRVRDFDGQPTMARLLFRDELGHVYPPQPKRLAPDFFFQPHVYRSDGETVLLPPGKFTMQASRGPEYRVLQREVEISNRDLRPQTQACEATIEVELQRWINPPASRLLCGRPSHSRRRLCALHEPDRRRHAGRHVPAGEGRGAERRLRAHLGAVLRLPAAVLRAARARDQRAAARC